MDEFFKRSDELHFTILHLLEDVELHPGVRYEVAMVACGLAFQHAVGLRFLARAECFTSALSLMRLQFETVVRGVWLLYAASDEQVQTLSSRLTLDSEAAARKMPMFSKMLDEVSEHAPAHASRVLSSFKEVNWHAMNSFVHSGIHPLRRHQEGYPLGLIKSAIKNSNALNVIALQLGVVLTGGSVLEGIVGMVQEDLRDVLPALIAPIPAPHS